MWLIVGLGNPEKKYAKNRHNVGFVVLDAFRSEIGAPDWKEKFKGKTTRQGDVVLLEPMTYMNLSGESVQPAAAFSKIAPSNILVVHDEIDLPFKDVRLKMGGGHAGNNGIRSIIAALGTPDFLRLRIGVGRPPAGFRGEVADWVLSDFDAVETAELGDVVKRAMEALKLVLDKGAGPAMNVINTRK